MRSRARLVAVIGGALAAIGLVGTVVYLLQPWRSCDYEDGSMGCAMLPHDAAAMTAFLLLLVLGAMVAVVGLVLRLRSGVR